MGHLIPISWYSKEEEKLAVAIPERFIPVKREKLPVEIREIYVPRQMTAVTYKYGGRMRVGVYGDIKPEEGLYLPVDLKLIAILRENEWKPIEERPLLNIVYWREKRWRAQIPTAIRRKYNIVPGETVLLEYTSYVTSWDEWYDYRKWIKTVEKKAIYVLKIYHLGTIYETDIFDETTRRWIWIIPDDIARDEALLFAMRGPLVVPSIPQAEIKYNVEKNYLELDFTIKPRETDRAVAEAYGRCRRNMRVKNYTVSERWRRERILAGEKDYPFLCEVRVYYLSTQPKEFYESKKTYMTLDEALRITLSNVIYYVLHRDFFPSFAEEKLDVSEEEITYEWEGEVVRTDGSEINREISFAEARTVWDCRRVGVRGEKQFHRFCSHIRSKFQYCYKEIWIYNITAFRKGEAYRYTNSEIEDLLVERGCHVDENGFVWRP